GFTAGDAIWVDGANHVLLFDNTGNQNLRGLRVTGNMCNGANTCEWDQTAPGTWAFTSITGPTGFAPNAIHAIGNRFNQNTSWGILEGDVIGGSVSPAYDNLYEGNTLEANGSAFATCFSVNSTIKNTYMEANGRGIVAGCVDGDPSIAKP